MLSGHDPFNYHGHIIGEVEDPECRLCMEDDESSLHLLYECPALGTKRLDILGYAFKTTPCNGEPIRCLPTLAHFINMVWEIAINTKNNVTP